MWGRKRRIKQNPKQKQNNADSNSRPHSSKSSGLSMVTMDSPSAQRNKDPIYSVIESSVLPSLTQPSDGKSQPSLNALEIAAGCGVHTTHFVSKLAEKTNLNVQWIPTDPDPPSLQSLRARVSEFVSPDSARIQMHEPISLSLVEGGISEEEARSKLSQMPFLNFIICINMIHISPWTATLGLFKVGGEILCAGGILVTYGPYKQNGTAVESNLNFDQNLKRRNPEWGVRDLEKVVKVAENNGFSLKKTIEMPANNLALVFVKNSL